MTELRTPPASDPGGPASPGVDEAADLRAEVASLRLELIRVTEAAAEQGRRSKLAREQAQHRARNTIGLVRSAFKRTIETNDSLEDVELHFGGRLAVLAHYMLPRTDTPNAMIDVESIIRDELQSFEFGSAPGVTVKGPDAELPLEQAQSFALAIHELATNALKFGALSDQKNAALSVTWKFRNGMLKLVWAETGVPIVVSAPVHRGFGQEFIEEGLAYQIGAVTEFERRPGGIVCTIEIQANLRQTGSGTET